MSDIATKTDLLSLQDRLNKLDAMADNPWGYKPAEWDEAYADAQYEARACKGMALGVQAADIAKRFKRAGKRFHACAELDLVPAEKAVSFSMDVRMAKAEPIGQDDGQQASAAAPKDFAANANLLISAVEHALLEKGGDAFAACRLVHKTLKAMLEERAITPIGPGDPLPPPPPPTKGVVPWAGEELYCTAKTAATGQAGVWSSQNDYQQKLWDAAAQVVNKRMGIKAA